MLPAMQIIASAALARPRLPGEPASTDEVDGTTGQEDLWLLYMALLFDVMFLPGLPPDAAGLTDHRPLLRPPPAIFGKRFLTFFFLPAFRLFIGAWARAELSEDRWLGAGGFGMSSAFTIVSWTFLRWVCTVEAIIVAMNEEHNRAGTGAGQPRAGAGMSRGEQEQACTRSEHEVGGTVNRVQTRTVPLAAKFFRALRALEWLLASVSPIIIRVGVRRFTSSCGR